MEAAVAIYAAGLLILLAVCWIGDQLAARGFDLPGLILGPASSDPVAGPQKAPAPSLRTAPVHNPRGTSDEYES